MLEHNIFDTASSLNNQQLMCEMLRLLYRSYTQQFIFKSKKQKAKSVFVEKL